MGVLVWVQRRRVGWIYGGLELASAATEVVQKELEVMVGGTGSDAQDLTGFRVRWCGVGAWKG